MNLFPAITEARPRDYVPTPAEIEEACAEIQLGWSPSEERARRGAGRTGLYWVVPGAERFTEFGDAPVVRGSKKAG